MADADGVKSRLDFNSNNFINDSLLLANRKMFEEELVVMIGLSSKQAFNQ